MKGDQHMLESNCMRGGMSCERSCQYDTSEPVCTDTTSQVCEDVPEQVCQTRLEVTKHQQCFSVSDVICSSSKEESTVTSSSLVSSSASYPDHPIHIPTFTLQRINNLLSSKARRGNTVTITPCHGPHRIMMTGDYPSLSSAQCDVPRPRRLDHRHGS